MKKTLLFCVAFAVLAQVTAAGLFAIPAFARKYQMTCKTCHAPFPRLKPYGDEFAGNGYVIKDKDAPRYFVDTGDSFLSLLREVPVALRFEGFLTYNNAHSKQLDFTSPYLLKFLSGGAITKDISYFFYFFFSEHGEVAGIEDAFVMFNNVFGTDFDFYIGQFQVSDPVFKRELRLSFEDYRIFSTRVGDSGIDLTYDRGIMLTFGLPTGTDFTLEVVNGSGIGAADARDGFDSDKYKNLFFRVSQDVASGFRIGGLGYIGKEKKRGLDNALWMAGADATVGGKNLELNLQYIERRDDNPFFSMRDAPAVKTRGGFAELVYLPQGDDSRWYATGLLNWLDSDIEELKYSSATLHVGRMLRRNIRATAELTYVFQGPYEKHARVAIGLVSGF